MARWKKDNFVLLNFPARLWFSEKKADFASPYVNLDVGDIVWVMGTPSGHLGHVEVLTHLGHGWIYSYYYDSEA